MEFKKPPIPDRVSSLQGTGATPSNPAQVSNALQGTAATASISGQPSNPLKRTRSNISLSSSEGLQDSIDHTGLNVKRRQLNDQGISFLEDMKEQSYGSPQFFSLAGDYLQSQHEIKGLQNKVSWQNFKAANPGGTVEDWVKSEPEVNDRRKHMQHDEAAWSIMDEMARRAQIEIDGGIPPAVKREFWDVFLDHHNIRKFKQPKAMRLKKTQHNVKQKIITAYKASKDDKEYKNNQHCPIYDDWFNKTMITAAHITPAAFGKYFTSHDLPRFA